MYRSFPQLPCWEWPLNALLSPWVDVARISTTIASRCNLVPFFVKLIPEIIRLGLGHWQNMQTGPPGTPDNHFFMDVW